MLDDDQSREMQGSSDVWITLFWDACYAFYGGATFSLDDIIAWKRDKLSLVPEQSKAVGFSDNGNDTDQSKTFYHADFFYFLL